MNFCSDILGVQTSYMGLRREMTKSIATTILSAAALAASVCVFSPTAIAAERTGPGPISGPGLRAEAPEIAPSSAIAALTLLAGGLTVLRSRVKK
ncbi:MAG TPA: hypothetical protein VHW71_00060 [Steroidobacteraceae bacterium]|jgi:hypothetical protein|nr:hypothetical protein [Steroidobacteraceae bacterium]